MLVAVAARELVQALPAVAHEVRGWRARARAIPDGAIRQDALSALADKRGHTDGAALFWTLAPAGGLGLLRLLVAYEIMWDFLDSANEHGATAGQANGRQLHRALIEGLDPDLPVCDHYRYHPWRADGGYLRALVEACRELCLSLPGYEHVRPLVVREAQRAQVLAINHDLDPAMRDATLRAWAAREFPGARETCWFELTGAASASLTVHVLLALAADGGCSEADLLRARDAYFPWISAATTMLDSFVDQLEDAASGDHSYVAHYRSAELLDRRVRWLLARSLEEARRLRGPEHHVLIVACMAAMYLSKDSARSPALCAGSARLARSGGSLTRALLPILRLWRVVYAQRST